MWVESGCCYGRSEGAFVQKFQRDVPVVQG